MFITNVYFLLSKDFSKTSDKRKASLPGENVISFELNF